MPQFIGSLNLRCSLSVVALLAAAAPALAQPTGRLAGHIEDEDHSPLPGAMVTVTSPSLMGVRVEFTDAGGGVNFHSLPPGVYTVDVELDGFVPQRRNEVEVRLNRVTELHVDLELGEFADEITVVAETPVVDSEQVSTSQTFTYEHLQESSVGSINRRYYNVLAQAPGVAATRSRRRTDGRIAPVSANPRVFGSTQGENVYYVDNIDSTDPVRATVGVHLNFDTIQEINFETGGFEARYGRATGGVVNVVTKSGGNDVSGTFDLRYRDTDFNTDGEHFDKDEDIFEYSEPSFTLGGPVRRDRLWFFTGLSRINSKNTPTGSPTARDLDRENVLGKLTWQASERWQLMGRHVGDRPRLLNANAGPFTSAEATSRVDGETEILSTDLLGLSASRFEWRLTLSRSRSESLTLPMSGDLETSGHIDIGLGYAATVNASSVRRSERDRDEVSASVAWFSGHDAGDHELRLGVDHGDIGYVRQSNLTGGSLYYDLGGRPHRWTVRPVYPPTPSAGRLTTVYLQDTWRPSHDLTVKFGLRQDDVGFDNDVGAEIASLAKLQPRLGVAWDVRGDGRLAVRGSWGHFMHPSALGLASFARVRTTPTNFYRSCSSYSLTVLGVTPDRCMDAAAGDRPIGGSGFGRGGGVPAWTVDPQGHDPFGWFLFWAYNNEPNRVQDGLDPTWAEQTILGVEMEVAPRTSLGLTWVDKETLDIIEDTCNGNLPTPRADAACSHFVLANLPRLTRDYRGILLDFETRWSARAHIMASYVWSESRGNVEYTRSVGSDFDVYPAHFENRYGFLSDHRKHRVKVHGHVSLPAEVILGFGATWSSPFVYTPWHWGEPYGRVHDAPRGSLEANENHLLDLQVSRAFRFGRGRDAADDDHDHGHVHHREHEHGLRFRLMASVYNLLDDEQVESVCALSSGCFEGSGLGEPTLYRQPRRFEVGVRLEF